MYRKFCVFDLKYSCFNAITRLFYAYKFFVTAHKQLAKLLSAAPTARRRQNTTGFYAAAILLLLPVINKLT
jgi:hypothetical protein